MIIPGILLVLAIDSSGMVWYAIVLLPYQAYFIHTIIGWHSVGLHTMHTRQYLDRGTRNNVTRISVLETLEIFHLCENLKDLLANS